MSPIVTVSKICQKNENQGVFKNSKKLENQNVVQNQKYTRYKKTKKKTKKQMESPKISQVFM